MLIPTTDTQLPYMYRTMCASTKLTLGFFGSVHDADVTADCLDAPIQLMPSGSCVNDRGIVKQGYVFNM